MKNKRLLSLLLIASLLFVFCSCEGGGSAPEPQEPESETETTDEVTADVTMENFVNKLKTGNYVVDAGDYMKTVVVSPEQVYFAYDDDSTADSFAFVTVNGETFEGMRYDETLNNVIFVQPGNAIDSLGTLLPNGWIAASDGNMFNLFYNNVDNPLEFTSYDETVKRTLLGLGGYGEFALSRMEEVHMLLNDEDPTTVRFTAVINDDPVARIEYDDLDLFLQFGAAESDPCIENWIKAPVYPPTRTEWTEDDIYTLDNVFLRDYGVEAVPFPTFASYAMNFDPNAYDETLGIRVTDAHGTEENVEEYKALLVNNGFSEVPITLEDGSSATVYRRLLREDYLAYSQLYPYYDNGFVLEGGMYYDEPVYEGLPAISAAVEQNGYAALPETDVFDGWVSTDTAPSRSEGWAYFFDYNLYLTFPLKYTDLDSAKTYLEIYGAKLRSKGFVPAFVPGDANGKYESANGFVSFRYTFNDDDTVTLEFKNEKSFTAEEAVAMLRQHGLPETDLHGDIGCRDLSRYRYIIGSARGLFLQVFQPFDSTAAAERFLDAYVPTLEEQGYYSIDPQKVGSQKMFLYFNEDLAKYVAFDLIPEDSGASVNFDFVSIEPEVDSIMLNAIRY
ncbi:MAG: hypothetical protein IJH91_01610 [Mogibacterium sp.]|nr:hypothetical protein [Mogibacterium sp.]